MRWDALFDDLELQWEAAEAADLSAEVADRSRRELAQIRLVDRLRPCVTFPLVFGVSGATADGTTVAGRLLALGSDWLLVEENGAREVLVPLRAVLWVDGLVAASAQPGHEGPLAARLDLRYALRGLARDRSELSVVLVDGSTVQGRAHRVGADFVEIARSLADEPVRPRAGVSVRTVRVEAISLVRRSG